MNNYMQRYDIWLRNANADPEIIKELTMIRGDEAEIQDRFYRELEFGTGGLRGVLGAGTNRMNIYTVAKATQGLSNYINHNYAQPRVALAYDSRINSKLFALTAARIFAANDIQVYIYPTLMPTPALSFAVRDLHCAGGVVITASHNPAKYNGYKVYGNDGCQITTEMAESIQRQIDQVDAFANVKWTDLEAALRSGRITYIAQDTIDRYIAAVLKTSVLAEDISKEVKIVYTPLNGTGICCVPRCLQEHGFTHITLVEEQKEPDGRFPTCPYPNPEIQEALEIGLRRAKETDSELLLATDPDCDRVGVAVRAGDTFQLITGNQMGVMLLDFICKMRRKNGTMPKAPVAVKTIVTTPMAAQIAANYGVELIDVLTGFKFIGEQIGLLEKRGELERFIFGFEESYGYLSGGFVRDKDAVNASLLICEMFAYYKAQGLSLIEVLEELYQKYGYYESRLCSYTFEGSSGFTRMMELMEALRTARPAMIADFAVQKMGDYQRSIMTDEMGHEEAIDLPKSNVLRFFFKNGCEAVVRPSGTEPKLKIYLTTTGESAQACQEIAEQLQTYFSMWVAE